MTATHSYRAYGLEVRSEMVLPELLPGVGGDADVAVRFGRVPEPPAEARFSTIPYLSTPGKFWFALKGLGRYFVEDGRSIVVQPHEKVDEESVRLFLLSAAFAALLHQRGALPLHASAVCFGDRCVGFLGESGKGKSTLAGAFARAGYRLVADDVLVVTEERGSLVAHPAYPQLKLAEDASRRLSWATGGLSRVPGDLDKYAVPIRERFVREPLEIMSLYILANGQPGEARTEAVEGLERVRTLMNLTYRLEYLDGPDARGRHLELCCRLAGQVPLRRLVRGESGADPERLRALLEAELGG